MDYLNSNAAPVREERLKTNIAFGGTAGELLECARSGCFGADGCLNQARRTFSQTIGCQFTLSLAVLYTMRKAVFVIHAPIGCGSQSVGSVGITQTLHKLRDERAEPLVWLSTNLDEADVITGGERKLRETVLFADAEFRPEAIIVCNTCVPSLIGDDLENIVNDLQTQVSATVVPVYCEGFKTKVMATAYDAIYHGVLKKYVRDPDRDKKLYESDLEKARREYLISRNVNILNVSSMSRADELEIQRLLTAIGLNVQFLPCYSEPEDFQYALESSLNVAICGTHDDYFVKHMQEKYGIPFIIDTIPIGRKNTARWLLKIAEHFELVDEARALIAYEDKLLDKALEPFRAELAEKTVFLGGGEVRVVGTAEIIQDLGMKIAGMKPHHFDEFIEPIFDVLEDIDGVPVDVATNQPFEQANLIRRIKPDLILSHTGGNNITAKYGVPILPIFGVSYNYMGYSGVYEVARRISRLLKNYQFNKRLSKNAPLPFKESWYEQDPFTYIAEI
ncbi:MAG: nitrogenase component 1 [Oscillospiraceae bacterium]|jgi:nitrogenase molybdenum-iron protein alpha chain|nr:nitrogenase component 1 [Oscillospiraceae bacterium]